MPELGLEVVGSCEEEMENEALFCGGFGGFYPLQKLCLWLHAVEHMQVLAGLAMADRGRSREEGVFLGSDGKASPELDRAFARWTAHVDLVRQRGESWFQVSHFAVKSTS